MQIDHQESNLPINKICFLDIDGVLNSKFWNDRHQRAEAADLVHLLARENMSLHDMTPDLTTEKIRTAKKFSLVKAREILAWLIVHPDVKTWGVLDDLNLNHNTVASHQVRTDANMGLTMEDIKAAKIILSQE